MTPNILLISLDTLRFDCLAAIGERRFLGPQADLVASPHLDRLAAGGALFSQAVSAAPFTTPSHASLFTGLWLSQHGAHHQYKTPIAADARTLAERCFAAGYRTAQSAGRADGEGVMFANAATGLGRGCETSMFAGRVDRATKKWLQKARGKPWFLFFHTFAAHWPYGTTGKACERLFADAWDSGDWSAVRELYVRNARGADAMVGELVDHLADLGELDRTIVVALSDHGEGLHRLAPLHGPIHGGREEVIRVPLVLHAPWAAPAGTRVDAQVRTVDILPTLFELAGLPPREEALPLAGWSLAPLIRGEAASEARPAFFTGHLNDDAFGEPLLSGVRTGRWKFIHDDCTDEKLKAFEDRLARNPGAALKADLRGRLLREMHAANEPVKLFDLEADPLESHNVAAEHPDVVAELSTLVKANLRSGSGAAIEGNEDAALEEQLRALGYLT
ncbi:MAG: sulfatase [Blastocatellia bacterium]|jgi:arylsulfatase A-like enzyme|nr:sulfatase [Blastocatellia bacterium]